MFISISTGVLTAIAIVLLWKSIEDRRTMGLKHKLTLAQQALCAERYNTVHNSLEACARLLRMSDFPDDVLRYRDWVFLGALIALSQIIVEERAVHRTAFACTNNSRDLPAFFRHAGLENSDLQELLSGIRVRYGEEFMQQIFGRFPADVVACLKQAHVAEEEATS